MSEIRLICISVAGKIPIMTMATVTDNACHFAKIEYLPRLVKDLRTSIAALARKSDEVNAELVIEDPTGLFTQYGRNLKLSNKDIHNKPVLVASMDKYTILNGLGALTYPDKDKSRFTIPTSMYNVKRADNGTLTYEINWDSLREESRIMLLTIYAGFCQNIFNDGYSNAFFNAVGVTEQSKDYGLSWHDDPSNKNGTGGREAIL